MSIRISTIKELRAALSIRDLTDPAEGPHAMQELISEIVHAVSEDAQCPVSLQRSSPLVSIADNYDQLRYPKEGIAREARYTRYVCDAAVLRTQTSALIPPLLRRLAQNPVAEILLACPGIVYRRDCIDRLHTGEPHQVDLWRVRQGAKLQSADLDRMIRIVVQSALPSRTLRTSPAVHPYTLEGKQIDVLEAGEWVEIGECGLAHPDVLSDCGLDPNLWSGLAMGVGLDRVLMLRKSIPDIRLLRSADPRIASQMLDLSAYCPVSDQPAVRRDLSLALDAEDTLEELGDRVRCALGSRAEVVESVRVLSETPWDALSDIARARLGLSPSQKNVLLRVVLRALDRTLTDLECNQLRDEIYAALHRGSISQWARASPHTQSP